MKAIDLEALRKDARRLWDLLERYSPLEKDAGLCLSELKPILTEVMNANVTTPYKRIPCGWYFVEGSLRKFSDLEEAYAAFAFRAEGHDADAVKALIDEIDNRIAGKSN